MIACLSVENTVSALHRRIPLGIDAILRVVI